MPPRERFLPEIPRAFQAYPEWARHLASAQTDDDPSFLAGAALAALNPVARDEHPIGSLWRQRLALSSYVERPARQGLFQGFDHVRTVRSYVRPFSAAWTAGLDEVRDASG